jgi:Cu/Zn superoxide dismutase
VNTNHGACCSKVDSLDSYGLVAGGDVNTRNTQVHGSAYIAGSGDLSDIQELENGCIITDD